MTTMLLVGLLCFAVRVADACGSDNEWGNGHENNMLCPGSHRDGIPDGTCYGQSAVPGGCCFAVTSYGETPSCSDPAYSPQEFEAGYTWPIGNWKAYGCCKPHVPYDAIIGGSVGGVVLIAIIIFGICRQRLRQRQRQRLPANQQGVNMPIQPAVAAQPAGPVVAPQGVPQGVAVSLPGRFDPNTGVERPKFDPYTGKQNW